MVSLTGSTETGKKIMQVASAHPQARAPRARGQGPDRGLRGRRRRRLAEKATFGAIMNTGQDCTAATRIYVEQSAAGRATEAVVEAMRNVKVGGCRSRRGPRWALSSRRVQLERVKRLRGSGQGGRRPGAHRRRPTARLRPRLLVRAHGVRQRRAGLRDRAGRGVRPGGHHSAVHRRRRGHRARQRRRYGLAASVFTQDVTRALRWPASSSSARCGSTTTCRSRRRARTVASSSPGFGKDLSARPSATTCVTKHIMVES